MSRTYNELNIERLKDAAREANDYLLNVGYLTTDPDVKRQIVNSRERLAVAVGIALMRDPSFCRLEPQP